MKVVFHLFISLLFILLPLGHIQAQNSHKNGELATSVINNPIVMGYYSQWAIYSPNIHIQDLPVDYMTHIVYKSAYLNEYGEIITGDSFADIEHLYPTVNIEEEEILGSFGQLIKLKRINPELKVIISIGGWGRSEYFSSLSSTKRGREKVAKSAIKFMQRYHFDGIEIDWQFPINFSSRKPVNDIKKKNVNDGKYLGLLMKELRRQCQYLVDKCWLQAVLAPYSIDDKWDARELSNNVNVLVLDASRIHGDINEFTEHQSPLFAKDGKRSIDQLIKQLDSFGVNKQKIVMAIPSFSIGWEGVKNQDNGLRQVFGNLSWGSWDSQSSGRTGVYNRNHLAYFQSSKNYEKYWDEYSKSSYMYNPDRFDGHFIVYETDRSIKAKVAYAKDHKLAGIAARQLHNGDFVLRSTYSYFYFWRGLYYKTIDFWQTNRSVLIVIIQLLMILFIFVVFLLLFLNKRQVVDLQERKKLLLLKSHLQNLEWPLINLLMISPELSKRKLIDNRSVEQTLLATSQILPAMTSILSETKLNNYIQPIKTKSVSLVELLLTVSNLIIISKNCQIKPLGNIQFELLTDEVVSQQFFYQLFIFCCESANHNGDISLFVNEKNNNLVFDISVEKNQRDVYVNHAQLKNLFYQASRLEYKLRKNHGKSISFELIIPKRKYQAKLVCPSKFLFCQSNQTTINRDDKFLNSIVIKSDKHTESLHQIDTTAALNNESFEPVNLLNSSPENSLMSQIASFNLSALPSKDIYKGLEQACQFFINYLCQDSKITIYQNEQLISKLGEDGIDNGEEKVIKGHDFSIKIVTANTLTLEDQQLIQVLVYQIEMIQKSIKALVKEPGILAELHELTRNKDQIRYLKAESGYTGIYLQSKKEPRYISMRLRTIKLYFDDSSLIQIHRSYLVNAKKVSHIESLSKLKYNMIIENEKLPISRTYISSLKEMNPQWFK